MALGCNGGLVVLGWCWGGSPLLFSSLHFSSTNGLLWPLGKRGSLTSEREKNNIILSYKVAIIICMYLHGYGSNFENEQYYRTANVGEF